jgi:hypothetical protein
VVRDWLLDPRHWLPGALPDRRLLLHIAGRLSQRWLLVLFFCSCATCGIFNPPRSSSQTRARRRGLSQILPFFPFLPPDPINFYHRTVRVPYSCTCSH